MSHHLIMLIPLIILAIGAIFAGFLFKDLFVRSWSNENLFLGSIN